MGGVSMDRNTRRRQIAEQIDRVASRYITQPGYTYVVGVNDARPLDDPLWVPGWDIFCGDLDEARQCAQAIAQELGMRTNVRDPHNSAIVYATY